MRISDWSSDVCSSDLTAAGGRRRSCSNRIVRSSSGDDLQANTIGVCRQRRTYERARSLRREPVDAGTLFGTRKFSILHGGPRGAKFSGRSEEHTSELQSLMRISYAVFCLKKKIKQTTHTA